MVNSSGPFPANELMRAGRLPANALSAIFFRQNQLSGNQSGRQLVNLVRTFQTEPLITATFHCTRARQEHGLFGRAWPELAEKVSMAMRGTGVKAFPHDYSPIW
jgi:hypothetical protein